MWRSTHNAPVAAHDAMSALREYMWRIAHWRQMDFDYALSDMRLLVLSPAKAYVSTAHRYRIRHRYARDDPAFTVVVAGLVVLCCLAYTVAFGSSSVFHFLRLVAGGVLVEFVGAGLVASSGFRLATQQFLSDGSSRRVEWMYAFDVHCNAFFVYALTAYVLQFFLAPWLLGGSWLSVATGNFLYLFATSQYLYVTFLGYKALPFVRDPWVFLLPVLPCAVLWVLATAAHFNLSSFVLHWYFGSTESQHD